MNVLIADDEKGMATLLESYLHEQNYTVFLAYDGQEAVEFVRAQSIDLVLLDVMMPHMDGLEACEEIRSFSDVPIIMLTAKGSEYDRVKGLKTGADDYIVKPFSPKELLARVEALLRRSKGFQKQAQDLFQFNELSIDFEAHEVKVHQQSITLTRKEFLLLAFLIKHKGQVFSRDHLLDQIWGMETSGTIRTVDTHIKTLRMKLKEAGGYIKTVWGVGYKFSEG